MSEVDVSIVIICMNNLPQLEDCLNSIKKYTRLVSYETWVVAYFFSEDNLQKLKEHYSWVKIIVSNEIRGFSANNNLALKEAQGKYCFVLNDDTYFDTTVIDDLYVTISQNEEMTLVSPQILSKDRTIQYSGIPPINWIDWLLILYKLKNERKDRSMRYIRKEGLFQTYNIIGAAFLIRTDIFRKYGFFDERYFFGPEDKALSTLLNKNGYTCFVNADIKLIHLGGETGGPKSSTVCATRPAERLGCVIMYSEGKLYRRMILSVFVWINSSIWACGWLLKMLLFRNKSFKYSFVANLNVCRIIFSHRSTTEIFKQFYIRR